MRSRQVSPAPSAFEPRIGPRTSSTSRIRTASPPNFARVDLCQLNVALASIVTASIAHVLTSREIREVIFDEIRAIVRQEIAQAPFADRLMDAAEAADRLGMTEAALRKAAARGTVPCEHRGRRLRFRLSVLMAESETRCGNQGPANAVVPSTSSSTLP